ncbi:hypothetical protein EYF80_028398 [Liparis tanakae]|uniref:Uncharacterized protein n=1 Tax=Liparis tanakae TaxID=230148 RepID=A0A4Z2H6Z1_9TELE|nr:hypothetical protein EYF80_028398 [Liparis tanakae]
MTMSWGVSAEEVVPVEVVPVEVVPVEVVQMERSDIYRSRFLASCPCVLLVGFGEREVTDPPTAGKIDEPTLYLNERLEPEVERSPAPRREVTTSARLGTKEGKEGGKESKEDKHEARKEGEKGRKEGREARHEARKEGKETWKEGNEESKARRQ